MFAVEIYAAVRRFVFVEGKSRREAARVFGLSRETIAKMCRYSAPPGYVRSKAPERPKLLARPGGRSGENLGHFSSLVVADAVTGALTRGSFKTIPASEETTNTQRFEADSLADETVSGTSLRG